MARARFPITAVSLVASAAVMSTCSFEATDPSSDGRLSSATFGHLSWPKDVLSRRHELGRVTAIAEASHGEIEAPSDLAISQASRILSMSVAEGGEVPYRVLPCADGGVTLLFKSGRARAMVDVYNDGTVVVGKTWGPGTATTTEIEPGDAVAYRVVDDVRRYLSARSA